jgi:hypothetical protein
MIWKTTIPTTNPAKNTAISPIIVYLLKMQASIKYIGVVPVMATIRFLLAFSVLLG